MSRIGRNPITIPAGTELTVEKALVRIKGPKGELSVKIPDGFALNQAETTLTVEKKISSREHDALFGLVRTLIDNAITGVTKGFEKQLEMNGVGFRVEKKGNGLNFSLGYSHKIEFEAPEGIELAIDGNIITVKGIDKQQVGQVAAQIRSLRKPEPYKGKGIKYVGERIRRKAGKAAVKGA